MAPTGPLDGVTVIDMTRVLAGPYCTMVLSDLGARVIKVEAPGGDDARQYGPFIEGADGSGGPTESAYFISLNRNKESIVLDLRRDDDRAVFEAMLEGADILVENFRPGTMDRLGYGWEAVHRRWPRLIYAATSGFGQTGPLARRAAYDMVVQGMGGIMSLTGHDGAPPTRVGTSVGDITAGLFTAVGINAALFHRTQSGTGMMIDVSMLDCQVAILENAIARYFASGEVPGPMGARHPSITPFEALAVADGHIVVAAGNNLLFRRLCEALGAPDLADDPRFAENRLRTENHSALKIELETRLARRGAEDWLARIDAAGVPCGPINNVAEALAQPQVAARNMVVEVRPGGDTGDDAGTRPLRIAGNPIKLSAFPDPTSRGPAPALDGNGQAIRASLQGRLATRARETSGT